jgi:hypothetical protein
LRSTRRESRSDDFAKVFERDRGAVVAPSKALPNRQEQSPIDRALAKSMSSSVLNVMDHKLAHTSAEIVLFKLTLRNASHKSSSAQVPVGSRLNLMVSWNRSGS